MLIPAASFSFGAAAQRTTAGQGMLSIEGGYPCAVGLSWGQYLPSSMWEAGAFAQYRTYHVSPEYSMPYYPAALYGDWMYRVAATRSRAFNLYAGAGVFLGWEFYDPQKTLPDFISSSLSEGAFLYGVNPKIQAELFFTRRMAVILSGSAPINFTSSCAWIQPYGSFGLRLDL